VAKQELIGISSSAARIWAAEETEKLKALCDTIAAGLRRDRERRAAAERELARMRSR
jgi:hypothetical protein